MTDANATRFKSLLWVESSHSVSNQRKLLRQGVPRTHSLAEFEAAPQPCFLTKSTNARSGAGTSRRPG